MFRQRDNAVPAITLRSKSFLFGAAILSVLVEPMGAVSGLVAVDILSTLYPYFMAFAAGAMLFRFLSRPYSHGQPIRSRRALLVGCCAERVGVADMAAAVR